MKDISLALETGVDIPLPELQLVIHQPSIKEISMIGEEECMSAVQCLTVDRAQFGRVGENALSNASNFQIFMSIVRDKELPQAKDNILNLFYLLVPNSKVSFIPRALLINYNGNNIMIDEGNFEYFQRVLKQIFCIRKEEEDFNPADAKAERIANKIKTMKKKVAHLNGQDRGSVFGKYLSVLSIGLKQPLQVIREYTVYQLNDSLERFNLYTKWDLEMRARMSFGGGSNEKLEDWTRNIHID